MNRFPHTEWECLPPSLGEQEKNVCCFKEIDWIFSGGVIKLEIKVPESNSSWKDQRRCWNSLQVISSGFINQRFIHTRFFWILFLDPLWLVIHFLSCSLMSRSFSWVLNLYKNVKSSACFPSEASNQKAPAPLAQCLQCFHITSLCAVSQSLRPLTRRWYLLSCPTSHSSSSATNYFLRLFSSQSAVPSAWLPFLLSLSLTDRTALAPPSFDHLFGLYLLQEALVCVPSL